jgi:hypothetical protein
MLHDKKGAGQDAGDDFAAGEDTAKDQGDGMHHHEIHEDEGGGFHSKHTHPDGRVEHEITRPMKKPATRWTSTSATASPTATKANPRAAISTWKTSAGSYGRAACE